MSSAEGAHQNKLPVTCYLLVPHSTLEKCISFKVHLVKDMIDPTINTIKRPPDHSVLEFCIKVGFTSDMITIDTGTCFDNYRYRYMFYNYRYRYMF